MRCILCGVDLMQTFFGPAVAPHMAASSWVCRNGYPLYEENGMHVAGDESEVSRRVAAS